MNELLDTSIDDSTLQATNPLEAHTGDVIHSINTSVQNKIDEVQSELHSSKVLPSALEAERGLIAALLFDSELFEQISLESLKPEHFHDKKYQLIFEAMEALHAENNPIDTVTVANQLTAMGKLETAGGVIGLSKLAALFPTSSHGESYARMIKEKSVLRSVIGTASGIVQSAFRQDLKAEEVLDNAERDILAIRNQTSQANSVSIKVLAKNALTYYEQLSDDKRGIVGVASGFVELDALTCGFQAGELIIVAARPSMGKTAFTLNIATYVAMQNRLPVAFFSLEMSAEQLVHRMIGAEGRLNLSDLRRGRVPKEMQGTLVAAAENVGKAPIYIDESPSLTVAEMRNRCRRMAHLHGIKLVIVDYLQLMTGPVGYNNKATEIGEISKGLKSIARELKVPVIALSQLNRSVETRIDKRPMMSDLRESGAIEQDADVISFLYREEYYLRDKTPDDKKGIAEVIISKNRNGPTGSLELLYMSDITRFVDLERDHNQYDY